MKKILIFGAMLVGTATMAQDAKTLGQIVAIQQSKIEVLEASMKGLIGSFANRCPTGWNPADGTQGTPDLRGLFVRGANDFGTGSRSDSFADPEQRSIGSLQDTANLSHSHTMQNAGEHTHTLGEAGNHSHSIGYSPYVHRAYGGVNALGMVQTGGTSQTSETGQHSHRIDNAGSHAHTIDSSGTVESRPKNMALVYCVKQ